MHRYDAARQRLAIGLAALAGRVDATGFVVAGVLWGLAFGVEARA
jgi:uncharacterized membrane protein YoaK (UPF0700 family)